MLFSHVRRGPDLNTHMHACIAHETTKRIIRGKEEILREGKELEMGTICGKAGNQPVW